MARFHFNQSAINNIKDDGQWYDYYYTFDSSINNEYDTTLNADITQLRSTLPNPHFDVDDDPENSFGQQVGNGYNDETEVTCLDKYNLLAETDYRFESYYKVVGYANNYFEHSSTMSWYDSVSGEYQSTGRAGAYQWHYGRWYTPQF
jgi:hypothetical protein